MPFVLSLVTDSHALLQFCLWYAAKLRIEQKPSRAHPLFHVMLVNCFLVVMINCSRNVFAGLRLRVSLFGRLAEYYRHHSPYTASWQKCRFSCQELLYCHRLATWAVMQDPSITRSDVPTPTTARIACTELYEMATSFATSWMATCQSARTSSITSENVLQFTELHVSHCKACLPGILVRSLSGCTCSTLQSSSFIPNGCFACIASVALYFPGFCMMLFAPDGSDTLSLEQLQCMTDIQMCSHLQCKRTKHASAGSTPFSSIAMSQPV